MATSASGITTAPSPMRKRAKRRPPSNYRHADAAAGSPWDSWDDLRHGPCAESAYTYPRCSEEALLQWEQLLGRQ